LSLHLLLSSDTPTTELYPLSLHDALPIFTGGKGVVADAIHNAVLGRPAHGVGVPGAGLHIGEGQVAGDGGLALQTVQDGHQLGSDRKSTRLNSSHDSISYAVFCLKQKRDK